MPPPRGGGTFLGPWVLQKSGWVGFSSHLPLRAGERNAAPLSHWWLEKRLGSKVSRFQPAWWAVQGWMEAVGAEQDGALKVGMPPLPPQAPRTGPWAVHPQGATALQACVDPLSPSGSALGARAHSPSESQTWSDQVCQHPPPPPPHSPPQEAVSRGEQACSGIPYPRISPHFPPFPLISPPFSPIFPRFPPFSPVFPHFPHFPHFSVAQKRLGDSGVGDFQGLWGDFCLRERAGAKVEGPRQALVAGANLRVVGVSSEPWEGTW